MTMDYKLPEHVIKQYGSSRGFRQRKRQELRRLKTALSQLRLGCAYLPNGPASVERIDYEVKMLERDLSIKNWGN